MRNELELMETIEKYLNGTLSETEKKAFEKKINSDPELQKEVQLQRELMQGINRVAIKQSAKQSFKKYKFNKNLKNWGLTGLTIAVIATSSVFLYKTISKDARGENAPNELPELNEQGNKLWSDADRYLPLQNFDINTEKDTVIETKDGIVFAIPAHSFLDSNGQPAKGNIQLEVKEALKAADIMKAGLTTRSGDKLLETGGMFYINARQDNASLKIDPKNALYAEIPADEVKPGMQLFSGKRLPNGTIDWVDPKPIQKDLIPVDILSLDFYPPNYIDSLKKWGYNTKDKKFTDSLYYAFASAFNFSEKTAIAKYKEDSIAANEAMIAAEQMAKNQAIGAYTLSSYVGKDTSKFDGYENYQVYDFYIKGINPAKVKTIWNEKFQNTLLATKEFEERMPYIHKTCDEKVLDLYINNLDKNLSAIDSMVARSSGVKNGESELYYFEGYPEFLQFAARGDGKVKNGNKNVELLKAYYQQRSKMYTEAIAKTVNEFWNKNYEKNIEATNKNIEQQTKDVQRTAENFKKELDLNITEAYRQLGKTKPAPIPPATYGLAVTTTGWNNVDKYVFESTTNRTSLNYTDPESGKKAEIKYESLSVTVNDLKNYDRVLVYLLPDELNSFMRVENKNNVFEEKLNELMIYKMVCIAYKGEESFYFSQDNVKPGTITVSLIKTSNSAIQNNVNKLSKRSQSKAMNDELNYIAFEKEEVKRQQEITKINELTNKIRPVIFPCMTIGSDSIEAPASARK